MSLLLPCIRYPLSGQMSRLDAFAFGFLHAMVSVVMLTLIHKEVNLEKQKES